MANNNLISEKEVPSNWEPVESLPSQGSTAPTPHDMPQLFSGSISPGLQHDTSFVGTETGSPRVPKNALMPFGAQANAFTNSATKSVTINNPTLQPVVPVTPPVSVGDGLLHGSLPWESDPSFTIVRDDFMYGQNTTANIGETRWQSITSSGVFKTYIGNFNNPGILQMYENTTTSSVVGGTGQAATIFPLIIPISSFWDTTWPIFDYPGWKMTWVFGLSRGYSTTYGNSNTTPVAFSLTKQSVYVGMGNDTIQGGSQFRDSVRPPVFFGCRFDTDQTSPAIGDTTFWLEAVMNPPVASSTRNNIQGTNGGAFNTGIVPAEGVFYRLDMVYASTGQLQMTLSGNGATATTTFTLTPMSQTYKSSGNTPIIFNGLTNVNLAGPFGFGSTVGYIPQGPGSLVTMSTWTSTDAPLNGTFTILQTQSTTGPTIFTPPGFVTPVSQATVVLSGYPSILPMATMGNSTEASQNPVTSRALNLDFFSFVSNGGLRGATTTNPLNSRFFN